jgi:AcrR family transcriptional regulator
VGRDSGRRPSITTAELFAARGYRGTSIAQVAARIGLTDAGVLHHFPTKQDLLLAVLEQRDKADLARLQGVAEGTGSPLAGLVELCRQNAATPGLVQIFTVIAAESLDERHPGHGAFVERYREARRTTADLLTRAQRAGELDADLDVGRAATQVLAMFDGLQLQWLRDPDRVDMVQCLEEFLDRLRPRGA